MRLHRIEPDTWLPWHVQSWRQAIDQVTEVWGQSPCATPGGVRVKRNSPAGELLRCRQGLQMEVSSTLRQLAGGHMGPWARRRTGRPRVRWEEALVRGVGMEWWHAAGWNPRYLATRIAQHQLP